MSDQQMTPAEEAEDRAYDTLYDAQEKYIRERFGDEAAEKANYGWGVDETGSDPEVQTKVYRRGVLTTWLSRPDDHTFQPF
jgi:hypothetical protein